MDEPENSDQLDSHYNWTSDFSTYRILIDVTDFLDLYQFSSQKFFQCALRKAEEK